MAESLKRIDFRPCVHTKWADKISTLYTDRARRLCPWLSLMPTQNWLSISPKSRRHLTPLKASSCRWLGFFLGCLACHSFKQIRIQSLCNLTDRLDSWPWVHSQGATELNTSCHEHQDQLLSGRTRQIHYTLDAFKEQTNWAQQKGQYDWVRIG